MYSPALLILCLLVGVPAVGYAQAEQVPAPPADAPTPPPLLTAPDEPEAPEEPQESGEPPPGETISRERTFRELPPDNLVPRLLLNPLVGTVATSGGVILGVILGAVVTGCAPFDGECEPAALIATGLGVGWLMGSMSVYAIGSAFDGRGLLWPTLLGGAVGMGTGVGMLSASGGEAWYTVPMGLALGAMVAYEISNLFERSDARTERDEFAGLQVVPMVGRTPEGGLLGGLVGRF